MKAILMSDRPEWVVKMLNGYKTIEIRKTMPKCDLPIEAYILCTNPHNSYLIDKRVVSNGMYYAITLREMHNQNRTINIEPHSSCVLNGKVIAKFTLRKVEEIEDSVDISLDGDGDCEFQTESLAPWELREESCLSERKLEDYIGEGKAYAWHISDLVIFDKPKELSEFRYKKVTMEWDENYHHRIVKKEIVPVKRPPQSWQYVEVKE